MIPIIGLKTTNKFETRAGTQIIGFINDDINPQIFNYVRKLERDYPKAIPRSDISSNYNCHGLIFSSRRCFIDNISYIPTILKEDQYQKIDDIKEVRPGDIIIYSDNTGIVHSGIVITKPDRNNLFNPDIISKWSNFKEYIHPANHCPYSLNSERQYFRIYK